MIHIRLPLWWPSFFLFLVSFQNVVFDSFRKFFLFFVQGGHQGDEQIPSEFYATIIKAFACCAWKIHFLFFIPPYIPIIYDVDRESIYFSMRKPMFRNQSFRLRMSSAYKHHSRSTFMSKEAKSANRAKTTPPSSSSLPALCDYPPLHSHHLFLNRPQQVSSFTLHLRYSEGQ